MAPTTTTRTALALAAAAALTATLASPRLSGLLANTALLAAGTLAIALPLGAVLGTAIAKVDLPGRRLTSTAMVAMLFVPLYVQAAAWNAVLGAGGWIPQSLSDGGYVNPWLSGWRAAVWVHAMAAVPWIALMTAASLRAVERRLEEESLLDASPLRVLCRVTLRRGMGGIIAAAVWVAVICATEIAVTDLFQIRTFAEEIYTQASLGAFSESTELVGSDFAVGVMLIALLAGVALTLATPWFAKAAEPVVEQPWTWRPRQGRLAIACLLWMLLAVIICLPVAGLMWKAGIAVHQRDGGFERSWSAGKAVAMVLHSPWENRREWGWSLAIASMAACATTALAVVLAWWSSGRPVVAKLQFIVTAMMLAVPVPLCGVWAIALFNQPRDSLFAPLATLYDDSLVVSALVQVARALPLAVVWMSSQFSSLPRDLLESARSEGAGPVTRFWRIGLPLRWSAVAAAAGLAFLMSITEVSATILVLPPGVTTLSVRIFQLLHYGVDDRVAAMALSFFVLAGGTVALWRVARIIAR